MFHHNLKYALRILFQNKTLVFWTIGFPIILGTFFSMAFSNIENSEKLETINIAIINDEHWEKNEIMKMAFQNLDIKEQEDGMFNIQYVEEKKAQELLQNDEITGYLKIQEQPKITVKKSGINETILKNVVEEINETAKLIETIIKNELQASLFEEKEQYYFENSLEAIIQKVKSYDPTTIKTTVDTSSKNLSYTMVEYYTLIAMACLYGGMLAMVMMNNCLANMSSVGKRIAISRIKKWTLIGSSAFASFLVQILGLILLFIYTILVLKVDYGSQLFETILLALVGALAGLSLGIFVSCFIKANENAKTGIILSITMFGCFLSGMMGITMKYLIDKNLPLLNKLNPAAMITDGLYSLYYYDTLNRFYFNIISLLLFSAILIFLSVMVLRRQKYDNI